MIKFHPTNEMLAEYAAGTLDWALSLSVSAHLQMCSKCRYEVASLNAVGGILLECGHEATPSSMEDTVPEQSDKHLSFSKLMSEISIRDAKEVDNNSHSTTLRTYSDPILEGLPKVVNKLILNNGKLKWKHLCYSLKMARLAVGQDKYEVAFHKIDVGGKVYEHDHKGLEVTVVLKGSFSDEHGIYNEGDFLIKKPGDIHRPTATQNQACLCLSVSEAPVAITGFMGKLLNPIMSIKPA